MTTRETLHQLIDELPGEQADLAQVLPHDLSDASGEDGAPLDDEAQNSLGRGLADVAAGRVKPLDQYKRERGL